MQGGRESYANFLSQNSVVDDAVGRVKTELEQRGLLDNTIIVYSSDQGKASPMSLLIHPSKAPEQKLFSLNRKKAAAYEQNVTPIGNG